MTKKTEKREIFKTSSVHDIPETLDEYIQQLQQVKRDFRKYRDIKISIQDHWGYYDDHWIEIEFSGIKKS